MQKDHTPERVKIIQLNEQAIRSHLGEMVRNTVKETLTACWMGRRSGFAMLKSTSARNGGRQNASRG